MIDALSKGALPPLIIAAANERAYLNCSNRPAQPGPARQAAVIRSREFNDFLQSVVNDNIGTLESVELLSGQVVVCPGDRAVSLSRCQIWNQTDYNRGG